MMNASLSSPRIACTVARSRVVYWLGLGAGCQKPFELGSFQISQVCTPRGA